MNKISQKHSTLYLVVVFCVASALMMGTFLFYKPTVVTADPVFRPLTGGSCLNTDTFTINMASVNEESRYLYGPTIVESGSVQGIVMQSDGCGSDLPVSVYTQSEDAYLKVDTTPHKPVSCQVYFKVQLNNCNDDYYRVNFTVNNINEAPTGPSLSNNSVDENELVGTIVGSMDYTDPDVAEGYGSGTYTYSVLGADASSFAVSGANLVTNAVFDYETDSTKTITLRITDPGGDYDDTAYTININDVNEAPTNISLSANRIDENSSTNTQIGLFSTTDPEGGAHTYTLVSGYGDNALFNIAGSYLQSTGVFNYETDPSLSIRVRSTDAGGLYLNKDFTILVDNVNEAPVISNTAPAPLSTLEDTTSGLLISAADPENDTIIYSVSTPPGHGSAVFSGTTVNYTPTADYFGTDSFIVRASDGVLSDTLTVNVTVTSVNDPPSFTAGVDQTVNEDASAQTIVAWAQNVSTGPANESGQTLTYTVVSNSNPGLFSAGPTVNANGVLQYTVAADANGSATIGLQISDSGDILNNGDDTGNTDSFTITVNPINDPPSFTAGADQTVLEDAGSQTMSAWAQNVSTGPDNESSQVIAYSVVGNTNPTLFSAAPAVSSSGTLTFTPAANANGSSTISLSISDNGGTTGGGDDTGPTRSFVITVTAVNDPPTFTAGTSPVISEDSAAQTFLSWAQGVSRGPTDESAQVLTYTIQSNSNSALFTIQPAVDSNGVLTFTPKADGHGTSNLSVSVADSGGSSNGGSAAGPTRTFSITIDPVNDAPVMDSSGSSYVASINEDNTTNNGTLVSDLLATGAGGSPISDVDDNALEGIGNGIAVIETQNSAHGQWEYSINGGTTWLAFGTPSGAAARLLNLSARVRFVPETNWSGSISQALTYRAWDQKPSSGSNGGTANINTSGTGLTSAFSSNYEIASFIVQPINDAPILDNSAAMKLDDILEDQEINPGTSVMAIIASAGGNRITEVTFEISPVEGIAVTAADNTHGTWQFSTNNGLDWTAFGTPTQANARLLVADTNTKIRFLPTADWSLLWNGAALPTITFQAWDQTSGSNGGTGNAGNKGLTYAFSTASIQATVLVTGRNDEPTFTKGADITLNEGASAQSFPSWVTNILAGPADEIAQGQTVHFNMIYNTAPELFTVQPALDVNGGLTFTPEPEAYGTATVIFELQDSGGTNFSGSDTSSLAFFVIDLLDVNDPPSFTPGANQTAAEDSGLQTVSGWAQDISAGPANEAWQDLTFVFTSNSAEGLFAVAPAISPSGTLTYTPALNANGSATLVFHLHDGGGSLHGGNPDSSDSTFTITLTPVNDASVNTLLPTIQGQAYVDQSLSAAPGTWNDTLDVTPGNITYAYQWQSAADASGTDLANIPSATSNQYTITLDKANRYVRVEVTATDDGEGTPATQSTKAYSAYVRVEGVNPKVTVSGFATTNDEDLPVLFSPTDFTTHYLHGDSLPLERIRVTALPQNGNLFLDSNQNSLIDSGESLQVGQEITADVLNKLTYQPNANWYGSDSFSWNATNALADGYPLPGVGVATSLTIEPVNDALTLTVPATVTLHEDVSSSGLVYTFGDVDVVLADPASTVYEMNIAAGFGQLKLASVSGLTFQDGTEDNSSTIVVRGTLADLKTAFNGVVYIPQQAYTGQDAISVTFNDNGSTGKGTAKSISDSTTVIISDVNNAPVNSLPQSFTMDLNSVSPALDFSFDDDSNSYMQFSFSALHGSISLPDVKSLTLISGANGSHAMTYRGPVLKVVKALLGLHYTPDTDYAGPETVTFATDDLGGTGTGGAKTDSDTLAIKVNGPPVGIDDSYYLSANSTLNIATPGVKTNDTDINTDPLTVSLVSGPAYGTLDLKSDGSFSYEPPKGLTGLVTFSYKANDGRLDSAATLVSLHIENDLETHFGYQSSGDLVTFTYTAHNPAAQSTFSNLNSSFKVPAGVEVVNLTHGIFTPDPSGGGTISADPQASLLPGESFSMSWTLRRSGTTPITGTWETSNDRTSDSGTFAEALKTLDEDNYQALAAELGTSFSSSKTRTLASVMVTALPQHGTIFVDANANKLVDAGEAVALNQVVAAVDLPALGYLANANWHGADAWGWQSTYAMDAGTAAIGPETVMLLTVQAVNDTPQVTAPAKATILEGTSTDPMSFDLQDVDTLLAASEAQDYAMTLACSHGTVALGSTNDLTFVTGADKTKSIAATASLSALRLAVQGLVYTPDGQYNGSDTLTLTLKDAGNSGSGGEKTAQESVVIEIQSANNAPVNSLPASLMLDVDTQSDALAFGFSDDSTDQMRFSMAVAHGSISVGDPSLLTLVSGANHSPALSYSGSVAAVQAALGAVRYQPDAGYVGMDTLVFTTDDLGGSGFGGPLSDTDNLSIKVNDAPVGVDDSYYLPANSTLTIAAPGVLTNDTDINTDTLTVSLVSGPAYGILDLKSDGSFSYAPPKGLTGLVTFSYKANDGRLDSPATLVSLHIENDLETHLGSQSSGDLVTFTYTAHNPAAQSAFANLNSSFKIPAGVEVVNLTHGIFTPDPSGGGTISADPQASLLPGESFSMSWTLGRSGTTPITGTWETSNDRTSDSGTFAEAQKTLDEDTYLALAAELGASFTSSNPRSLASVQATTLPQHGTLFVDANGNTLVDTGETISLNQVVAAMDLPALGYLADANWHGADAWGWQPTYALDAGTAAIGPETVMTLTVQAVNDTPQVTAPAKVTTLEGAPTSPMTFDLQDVDTLLAASEAQNYAMTLACSHGSIALGSTSGLTFVSGADKTKSIAVTASLNALRLAAQGLVYTPDALYDGSDTLTLTLKDAGNSGSGGEKSAQGSVAIEVQRLNRAPINSLPASLVVDADTQSDALAFGFSDDSTDQMQFSMTVEHGGVSVGDPSQLTLVSGANHSPALSYSGSVTAVQTALNAIRYQPDAGYVGLDTLVFTTNDLGGTGAGGAKTDSDTLVIKVNGRPVALDDAYDAFGDSTLSVVTGGVLSNDTDPNQDNIEAQLVEGPAAGTLTLAPDGSFTYAPPSNFEGEVSFSYQAYDGRLASSLARVKILVVKSIVHIDFRSEGNQVIYTFTAHNPTQTLSFSDVGIQFTLPAGAQLLNLENGISGNDANGHTYVQSNPIPLLGPGESYIMTWTIRVSQNGPIQGLWTIFHDGVLSEGQLIITRYFLPILVR